MELKGALRLAEAHSLRASALKQQSVQAPVLLECASGLESRLKNQREPPLSGLRLSPLGLLSLLAYLASWTGRSATMRRKEADGDNESG